LPHFSSLSHPNAFTRGVGVEEKTGWEKTVLLLGMGGNKIKWGQDPNRDVILLHSEVPRRILINKIVRKESERKRNLSPDFNFRPFRKGKRGAER